MFNALANTISDVFSRGLLGVLGLKISHPLSTTTQLILIRYQLVCQPASQPASQLQFLFQPTAIPKAFITSNFHATSFFFLP